jgi:hypothetical protein
MRKNKAKTPAVRLHLEASKLYGFNDDLYARAESPCGQSAASYQGQPTPALYSCKLQGPPSPPETKVNLTLFCHGQSVASYQGQPTPALYSCKLQGPPSPPETKVTLTLFCHGQSAASYQGQPTSALYSC